MRYVRAYLVFALCLFVAKAHAETPQDRAYARILAEVIEPGYATLALAASGHRGEWKAFCAKPDDAALEALKISYHRFADAWASVEFVRSGFAVEEFRADRIYFWPERQNAVERALTALLSGGDETQLEPEALAKASAAIQGLPAIERLLFSETITAASFAGNFRCKAGAAIAGNAAVIAAELDAGPPGGWPPASDLSRAALATDIVTAFTAILDKKLGPAVGASRAKAKPRQAEAWRSGRSLRNIELNLDTLNAIAKIVADAAPETKALPLQIETARAAAAEFEGDLGELAAGGRRGAVILLKDAVYAAGQNASRLIPAALGVTIGFSSFDGD